MYTNRDLHRLELDILLPFTIIEGDLGRHILKSFAAASGCGLIEHLNGLGPLQVQANIREILEE
jgi:hypothetical protein